MAAIKGILESPTMATIRRKEATRRKLARSKVKNMEMSLQVSLHWQSVTWDCELLKPKVFFVILPNQATAEEKEGEEDKEDLAKLFADTEHPVFLLVSVVWICFEQNQCVFLLYDFLISRRQQKTSTVIYTVLDWRKIGCTATWVDGHPMSPESVFADILPSRTVEISSCGDQGKPSSSQRLHLSFQINMQVAIKIYLVQKVKFYLNMFEIWHFLVTNLEKS